MTMLAKDELRQLIDVLSEDECTHLRDLCRDAATGERFWEDDAAVFYNEYVKVRNATLQHIAPTGMGNPPLFVDIPLVKSYPGAALIRLPQPLELQASLGRTIAQRRSIRRYTNEGLTLTQLSTLLQSGCGVTGFTAGYDFTGLPLRTFPSSGGLQSPEVYLGVKTVDGIAPGIYHYRPIDHALECLRVGDEHAVFGAAAIGQPYASTSALVILLTGYYTRLRWKYGERAYRYMCMDVGFAAQNLCLTAEALELGACAVAGFADATVERLIGIDGRNEMALLLMTVGIPDRRTGDASE